MSAVVSEFDAAKVRGLFLGIKADVPSAISDNRYWIPLCEAIEAVASRQCVASEEVWAILKAQIDWIRSTEHPS